MEVQNDISLAATAVEILIVVVIYLIATKGVEKVMKHAARGWRAGMNEGRNDTDA